MKALSVMQEVQMFKGCCIMGTDEAAWKVLATPTKPRLLNLLRRFSIMSESYHAGQLPLFPSPELEAYLAGVIKGDGWCTGYSIGLRVADRDFAEAFAAAITQVFNVPLRIGQERQRYWIVRTSNKTGKY